MENLSLSCVYFENTVLNYLIAIGMFVLLITVFWLLFRILGIVFEKMLHRTTNTVIALLLRADQKLKPILWYLPFYIVSHYLILPPKLKILIGMLGVLVVTICIVRYAIEIIKAVIDEYSIRTSGSPMLSHSIGIIANIFLWIMAVLFLLSNFGFNVTTLITGLGIGGMAIALASQTLLGDLFNYFTIIIDRPFIIGDTVKVGGVTGTVLAIGLKGTRLRAADGEQVILSNTDMTKSILYNYQMMNERRVLTKIGIKCETPQEKIKEIPSVIKRIVQSVEGTNFVRAHFYEFGDFSLNYEIVYFVLSKDYGFYMDILQKVNFAILDEFAQMGIEFAFPSQSIYMEKQLSLINEKI